MVALLLLLLPLNALALPENRNLIGIEVRALGWVIGGMVMMAAFAMGCWVARQRNHRVIRMGQPIFLLLICVGVLLLASATIPLGIDDSITSIRGCDAACASIPFLLSMGLNFVFAALYCKLWRVNTVMRAAFGFRSLILKERDVIRPFVILNTILFALLLSWTFVDPLRWERVVIDEANSCGRCVAEGKAWIGFLCSVTLLNAVTVAIANVESFKARDIDEELSEWKFVTIMLVSFFLMSVVGLPLLMIVYRNPPAYFFVWTTIIFLVSSSILGLIFFPKIIKSRSKPISSAEPVAFINAKKVIRVLDNAEDWEQIKDIVVEDAPFACQCDALSEVATVKDWHDWMVNFTTNVCPKFSFTVKYAAWDARRKICGHAAEYHVTHTGDGGPCPATNKTACTDYFYHVEMDEDDKVKFMLKIWNDLECLKQLGWVGGGPAEDAV